MSEDSLERYGGVLAAPPRHRWRTVLGVIGAIHAVVIVAFIVTYHHGHSVPCRVLTQPGGSQQQVQAVAFRPHSRELLILGATSAYLWDAAAGRQMAAFPAPDIGPGEMAFSPDGATLAIIDPTVGTGLWDVATDHLIATLPSADSQTGPYSVAFSPDGRTLAIGNDDGSAVLWDVTTRQLITTLPDPSGNLSGPSSVAFAPDGRTLAAHDTSSVYLWDVTTRRLIATVTSPDGGEVYAVAFGPDHRTLAIGAEAAYLWDVMTRRLTATLAIPGDIADAMAFSPDGRILAAGTNHNSVAVWDAATGHQTTTFTAPGDAGITFAAFSPDSRTLAVGDETIGNTSRHVYLCPMR